MALSFVSTEIENYASQYSTPNSDVLEELTRKTHLTQTLPQMLSGQMQGNFLSMVSGMLQPKLILEIGTFTGYSAICMAEGLAKNGVLHTIDIDEELKEMAESYFEKSNNSSRIKMHIGQAENVIKEIPGPYDLVFIDADKENYSLYFDLVIDQVPKGGIIIADNVLWSGKVLEASHDKETEGLQAYNQKIQADVRVKNLLLPFRDGLMIAQKIV